MPTLKDIRRRIISVQKTRQITRAMRMVSAAKLRRAQERIESARPYADHMRATLADVARRQPGLEHPLFEARPKVRCVELVVVTSDRGLAGAFNANVLKRAQVEVAQAERMGSRPEIAFTLVGRKALEFYRRRRPEQIRDSFVGRGSVVYEHAVEIAARLAGRFLAGDADRVVLVYSEFVSAMTQRPCVAQVLPVAPPEAGPGEEERAPYHVEPSEARLLEVLVPKALEVEIYRALLENQAGEHAARMTAMESATRNTEELIDSLKLQFNRARQAAITKELMEIVSGAEAL